MNPAIRRGIARWRPGSGFQLYRAAKQLTLDVATEVFVGSEPSAEADRLNAAFINVVVGGQAIIRADVPGGKWHRGLESRRVLERYFRSQLPAKRASEGDDLFSVLCHAETEDGERFSDEDVVNHMIFTMMAAHDTSTITLTMMGYYLARHPEWQDRLREESRALGKDDDRLRRPRCAAVDGPRVQGDAADERAGRARSRARRSKTPRSTGCYVPKGTKLMLGIYPTQRMEPWWRNPDTFDPERFSEARREDATHKYAWAPFGGGVHKCIGMHFGSMEVKAIMHQLLLRNSWRCRPATSRSSTTAPARSRATASRSSCARCSPSGLVHGAARSLPVGVRRSTCGHHRFGDVRRDRARAPAHADRRRRAQFRPGQLEAIEDSSRIARGCCACSAPAGESRRCTSSRPRCCARPAPARR